MAPLPGSRDYDAVDAGPLPHTTVNNLQDSIVGAKHGQLVKFYDVSKFTHNDGPEGGADWTWVVGRPAVTNVAGQSMDHLYCAIDVPAGSIISQVDVLAYRGGDAVGYVGAGITNYSQNFLELVTDVVTTGTFLVTLDDGNSSLPITVPGVGVPAGEATPPLTGPFYILMSSNVDAQVARLRYYGAWVTFSKP